MSTTYAGDSSNYPTSVTVAADGDPRQAASVAVAVEGALDRTAFLMLLAGAVSPLNCLRVSSLVTTPQITGATWDDESGKWVFLVDNGTTKKVYASGNAGTTVAELGTSPSFAGYPNGIASSPTAVVCIEASNGANVYTKSTGVWSTASGVPSAARTRGSLIYFAGAGRFVGVGGVAGACSTYYSPNATGTGTWTGGLSLAAMAGARWVLAASATTLVLMSSDGSYNNNYYTTTDGSVWTSRSTASFQAASEVTKGLTYSSRLGAFFMTVKNAAGTGSRVYASPDGISWILASTLASNVLTSIATIGSVVLAAELSSTTGRLLYSTDNGVTWRRSEFDLLADATTTTADQYFQPQLRVSATRFVLANSVSVGFSVATGTASAIP